MLWSPFILCGLQAVSEIINSIIAADSGQYVTKSSQIRNMRAVKKETLKLLEAFIERSEDNAMVAQKFVPPLLDPVLGDYCRNIPDARDPEVRRPSFSVASTKCEEAGGHDAAVDRKL